MHRFTLALAGLLFGLASPHSGAAQPMDPGGSPVVSLQPPSADGELCCTILSMNHRLGQGTARDHRSGEEFSFRLKKRSLAGRMRPGELLRLDGAAGTLTLYAPEECCQIVGSPSLPSISGEPGLIDCCTVLSFAPNGEGSAQVRSTGETFQFFQIDARFTGMKPGDRLWLEPRTGKVGVARDLECCSR